MWNSCLEWSAPLQPTPPPQPYPLFTTDLYSDINPDDSPVKGSKRGKGKKEKKRPAADLAEKKKPKLDELKVNECEVKSH